MAEINVERRGPSVWPWILGLMLIALVIWGVAELVQDREPAAATIESVQPQPATLPAPVAPAATTDPEQVDRP